MKDLLSKEHCYCKIDILLLKSSPYPPSIDDLFPIETTHPSFVLQENVDVIFKILTFSH